MRKVGDKVFDVLVLPGGHSFDSQTRLHAPYIFACSAVGFTSLRVKQHQLLIQVLDDISFKGVETEQDREAAGDHLCVLVQDQIQQNVDEPRRTKGILHHRLGLLVAIAGAIGIKIDGCGVIVRAFEGEGSETDRGLYMISKG